MTKKVFSISPDASILEAAKIISEHNFDGLPVTDKENHLVGIITEYDLILRTSTVNSSFLQKVLNEVRTKKQDEEDQNATEQLSSLKVSDIMNKEPLALREDMNFEEAVAAFITHHKVNPIPVVDKDNKVVGIISRYDALRPLNLLGYTSHKK